METDIYIITPKLNNVFSKKKKVSSCQNVAGELDSGASGGLHEAGDSLLSLLLVLFWLEDLVGSEDLVEAGGTLAAGNRRRGGCWCGLDPPEEETNFVPINGHINSVLIMISQQKNIILDPFNPLFDRT